MHDSSILQGGPECGSTSIIKARRLNDHDIQRFPLDESGAVSGCSLVEAFRRPTFPSWAKDCLEVVKSGEIYERLDRAIAIDS